MTNREGGWPTFTVTILTEAAPAFLLLESWAPLAFAPPIFSLPTEPRRLRETSLEGRVRGAQLSKRTKAGAADIVLGRKAIEAVPASHATVIKTPT